MLKRISIAVTLLSLALFMSAPSALAAITRTINAANAPTGTHFQQGDATCSVSGLTVTCTSYQLAGVGNTNATASLVARYTATVDCYNPGVNPQNPIESHTTTFDASSNTGQLSPKNGRLTVPQLSVSPTTGGALDAATYCPNANWEARIRAGTLRLVSFTYTLTFTGFGGAYITITGP
jgi:hypothetical protein